MFAITGITGQVGGVLARALLTAGQNVRAVVRSAGKGEAWAREGCELALADMNDAAALRAAFTGVQGVFILLPPNFAPSPGFPESRRIIDALRKALAAAAPDKVVCLSTIGAQASQTSLLSQLGILEQELGTLPIPVAFLRAAWFMENTVWDLDPARTTGVLSSFLQPLDKPVPMVATADVGRVAAELLQDNWTGTKIVELEGPERIAPNDLAAGLAEALRRDVRAQAVPRDTWKSLFKSQGTPDPTPRMRMLDGFNEGWIEFETGQAGSRKAATRLSAVLRDLVRRA